MKITTCLVGTYSSGKTSLVNKYILKDTANKINSQSTIGMSSFEKFITIDNTEIKNTIFDTAGQERYAALIPIYLRNCDILIFTIDPTNYNNSLHYFKTILPDIIHIVKYVIICFTKIDIANIIESESVKDIDDILNAYNKPYKIIYTSSFQNKNVETIFTFYLSNVLTDKTISYFDKNVEVKEEPKKECCVLS